MKISVKKLHDSSNEHDEFKNMTPEERLDILEYLRIQSGKFLYEYPARFRRVIKIIRTK